MSIDLKEPAFISRTIRSSFSSCNVPCCLPVKTVIEFLKASSPLKDIVQKEFFCSELDTRFRLAEMSPLSLVRTSLCQQVCWNLRKIIFSQLFTSLFIYLPYQDMKEIHLLQNTFAGLKIQLWCHCRNWYIFAKGKNESICASLLALC